MRFTVAFMFFIQSGESLYDLELFYDIDNTVNEHNRVQTHYLSLVLNYFDIYF